MPASIAARAPLSLIISYYLIFGNVCAASARQSPGENSKTLGSRALRAAQTRLTIAERRATQAAKSPAKLVQPPPAAGGSLKPFTINSPGSAVQIEMLPVPAGTISVALPEGKGTKAAQVKPLWIARTETTWEQFDAFTSSGPPSPPYDQTEFAVDAVARPSKSYIPPDLGWGHHGYPAIHISALNAEMYCRWLAKQTGKKFRLPTEVEWEFACRAGMKGNVIAPAALDKSAWTLSNSDKVTHPVGKKQPNAWGLYDMLGNAGEWASDLAGKPVLCGGFYNDKPQVVSPAKRAYWTPAWQEEDPQIPKSRWWLSDAHFAGFRVVCDP